MPGPGPACAAGLTLQEGSAWAAGAWRWPCTSPQVCQRQGLLYGTILSVHTSKEQPGHTLNISPKNNTKIIWKAAPKCTREFRQDVFRLLVLLWRKCCSFAGSELSLQMEPTIKPLPGCFVFSGSRTRQCGEYQLPDFFFNAGKFIFVLP